MRQVDPNRTPNRNPNRTPGTESHERTNERTNEDTDRASANRATHSTGARVGQSDVVGRGERRADAAERPEGFVTLGDVLASGQFGPRSQTRHPRVRIGERDPIPLHVRAAVWYRDGGRCDEEPCPPTPYWEDPRPTHLDHIQPWSAGGSDTTDNLRLLCEPHNLERSNFIDWARPKRPATWWCHRCHDLPYEVVGPHTLMCPLHPYGWDDQTWCRAARAAKRWQDASWFMVPAPEEYTHIAYCAHCNAPGLTGVPL